jgi:hypothetical protein
MSGQDNKPTTDTQDYNTDVIDAAEFIYEYLRDWNATRKDPTYRAELTTREMHLGQPDKRYPKMGEETTAWLAEHDEAAAAAAAADEAAAEEAELARQHIFSYPDGSNYMGHMRDGQRHGSGTLRTAAFVYGEISAKNYTSDEAADNAHLAKWHEYAGMWQNDKMHGHGVHVRKSGDGGEIVVFEGIWENGVPKAPIYRINGDDNDNEFSTSSVYDW